MKPKQALVVLLLCTAACGPNLQTQVVRQYAVNLDANYKDAIGYIQTLNTVVSSFIQNPTQAGFVAAQQAWLAARPSYGQCEVSRFYGGPIDQAQGRMNEWPVDESFIDYTEGNPDGGIINDLQDYPLITPDILNTADEQGGTENLSLGFHAIEFLLWGQRPNQTSGPGQRPYTDYVDGGTAANQDRRRTYLQIATQLLLSDMQALDAQWDLTNPNSYGSQLLLLPTQQSLSKIVDGFSQMAISELLYERLDDPYVTMDQKDEESCFSETTYTDLVNNALGIQNVYLGHYQAQQGPGLTDLVKAQNPQLDATMQQQLQSICATIDAIPPPFDVAVLSPPTSPANQAVQAAIAAFMPLMDTINQMASTLGLMIDI
jgi:putative iron-regulated protein